MNNWKNIVDLIQRKNRIMSKIIQKTSNEEGKYAENLMQYLYKSAGYDYVDVSDDKEYQKIDVDAIIKGKKVEIKNDTWIARTKNIDRVAIYFECGFLRVDRRNDATSEIKVAIGKKRNFHSYIVLHNYLLLV